MKNQSAVETKQDERAAKAKVKFLRIAPRKMRLVIDAIRFQHPDKAFRILENLNKKAARMVEKLLKSAVANAKVLGMDDSRLVIADVRADGGPVMKRFMERSMGRANRIIKRTTHLSMILKEGQKQHAAEKTAVMQAEEKVTVKSGKPEKTAKRKTKMAGKA